MVACVARTSFSWLSEAPLPLLHLTGVSATLTKHGAGKKPVLLAGGASGNRKSKKSISVQRRAELSFQAVVAS